MKAYENIGTDFSILIYRRNKMSNYLLLRDNQQSGPYSIEQLKNRGLRATDLVWVQGESDGWAFANEIPQLHELMQNAMPVNEIPLSLNNRSHSTSERSGSRNSAGLETKFTRPLDEIKDTKKKKEKYEQPSLL